MRLKQKIHELKQLVPHIYLALKHQETPWYAKMFAFITVGYALSPIDLIPDFIPVIGLLDDIIILPVLVGITIRLVPKEIWQETEEQAKALWKTKKPKRWGFAAFVILIYALLFAYLIKVIFWGGV